MSDTDQELLNKIRKMKRRLHGSASQAKSKRITVRYEGDSYITLDIPSNREEFGPTFHSSVEEDWKLDDSDLVAA